VTAPAITLESPVSTVTHRELVNVFGTETLRHASELMADGEVGALLVRRGTHAVGIITERDVVLALADGADVDDTRVQDVMSEDLAGVMADFPLRAAVERMANHGIRHLIVRSEGRIVGIVSARDILRVLRSVTETASATR
jgi:CBS domain-containing protein